MQALCSAPWSSHVVFDGDRRRCPTVHDPANHHGSPRDGEITILAARADTAPATTKPLADYDVVDLTIKDPPIDDVIEQVFADAGDAP